jgi:hypothetical protein
MKRTTGNEPFEKFEAGRLGASIEEIQCALKQERNSPKSVLDLDVQNDFAVWQAAEAHLREQREEEEALVCLENFSFVECIKILEKEIHRLREPQTPETCKATPPHSMGCLAEEDLGLVGAGGTEWKTVEGAPTPRRLCLICLLDRLPRARETCAVVYQWAAANHFPVELLDNLSLIAQSATAEEVAKRPYHDELPVAVDLTHDRLAGRPLQERRSLMLLTLRIGIVVFGVFFFALAISPSFVHAVMLWAKAHHALVDYSLRFLIACSALVVIALGIGGPKR